MIDLGNTLERLQKASEVYKPVHLDLGSSLFDILVEGTECTLLGNEKQASGAMDMDTLLRVLPEAITVANGIPSDAPFGSGCFEHGKLSNLHWQREGSALPAYESFDEIFYTEGEVLMFLNAYNSKNRHGLAEFCIEIPPKDAWQVARFYGDASPHMDWVKDVLKWVEKIPLPEDCTFGFEVNQKKEVSVGVTIRKLGKSLRLMTKGVINEEPLEMEFVGSQVELLHDWLKKKNYLKTIPRSNYEFAPHTIPQARMDVAMETEVDLS